LFFFTDFRHIIPKKKLGTSILPQKIPFVKPK
jgi:hypothetical protein